MTALVALLGGSRDVARTEAGRLLGRMKHRGREQFLHAEPGLVLGVRADEIARSVWIDPRCRVILDARIDNRAQLVSRLGVPVETPDAELVGRASLELGDDWPKHVLGDFAAIVWRPTQRVLTVTRDPVGVRWLYWTSQGGVLRCASEMPALIRSMDRVVPSRLQMALYLTDQYDERDETLVERLHGVPPAHVVRLERGGETSRRRYWSPYDGDVTLDRQASATALRAALEAAVAPRLEALDAPVATHLSGGLDSTAVAAAAARVLGRAGKGALLRPVSLVFPGLACDERPFSRATASYLGAPLAEVDPFERPALLTPMFGPHAHGGVYFHPTVAMMWSQLEASRSLGARTVLTGLGSDHAVHRDLHSEARSALFHPLWLRDFARRPRLLLRAVMDTAVRGSSAWVERELLGRRQGLRLQVAREVDGATQARFESLRDQPHRDEVQLHLLACLTHDLLVPLSCLDRMGARMQSVFAHPFLDRRVLELLFSLPHAVAAGRADEFKKPLLRASLEGLVPTEVLERRSLTEFNPFIRRVLESERPALHQLKTGLVRDAGLLEDRVVLEMIGDLGPPANLRTVVDWLGLEVWLRSLESGEQDGRDA